MSSSCDMLLRPAVILKLEQLHTTVLAVVLALCLRWGLASGQYSAVAVISVGSSGGVSGQVTFTELADCSVGIVGFISGLKPDFLHGLHVHALGDVSRGCESTGAHWNPTNKSHGDLNANVSHAGDLGNVQTNSSGMAAFNLTSHAISKLGISSLLGRTLVIHNGTDDLGHGNNSASLLNGNCGARLACGVIGIAASSPAAALSCGVESTSSVANPEATGGSVSALTTAPAASAPDVLLLSSTAGTSRIYEPTAAATSAGTGQSTQTPTAAKPTTLSSCAPHAWVAKDAVILIAFCLVRAIYVTGLPREQGV